MKKMLIKLALANDAHLKSFEKFQIKIRGEYPYY